MSADALIRAVAAAAVAATAGCTRLTGPTPVDTNWRTTSSAHIELYTRPGSFGDAHADFFLTALEDQYAVSLAALEAAYEGRVLGFLYDTAADAGLTSERQGVAFPLLTDAFSAVASPPLDDNLLALLGHEANHVIARHAAGQPGSSCMNEGLASALLSERYHDAGPAFLHRWTGARIAQVPPLARLCDDEQWEGFDHSLRYNASASFIAYLLQTRGAGPLKQLYRAPSGEFASRFSAIYGEPLDAAEARWRAFTVVAR